MQPVFLPPAGVDQGAAVAASDALQELRALIGAPPPGGHRRELLIEHLHQLNDHYRGLFERHLVALAGDMLLPMAELHQVAACYPHFELLRDGQTPAALTLRVCEGLSCTLAGSADLLARLPALLGTAVRVRAAPCLGRCEQAPAVLVGQRALAQADLPALLQAVAQESNRAAGVVSQSSDAANLITFESYRAQGGYALAAAVVNGEEPAEGVIRALEDAGLRGLGGAGVAAGRKWRLVRAQPGPRFMAVNLNEGEPGSFKDRSYLERDPHRFLEGMLIAAQVTGTEACYIYLRDEYHDARKMLTLEIEALQSDPPCPLPDIELRRGAGAYLGGEESALLESIEGKRAQPRPRPPDMAEAGLFGKPTLVHNFETLFWVRDIVEKGGPWFSAFGRHGRHGLRSFSVSGRVKQPGVKRAPAGITLQELLAEHCGGMLDGHTLYAYLPGGAAGGILPAHLSQLPLDFDTLQPYGGCLGSAAIVVLSQHDRARDAALHAMRFFAAESCGQCTSCRVGTVQAAKLMEAPVWNLGALEDLNSAMQATSICGLGQAAPNPVRCVQNYFAHEIGG